MSLRGIFDPMVRAYFKNQFGGGGSGTSNFKYRILSNPREAVEFTMPDGTVLQKVSDYFPVKLNERNEAGFLEFSDPTATSMTGGRVGVGGTALFQLTFVEGMEMWSAGVTEGGSTILVGFNQEALDILKQQEPEVAAAFPQEPGVWLFTSSLKTQADWVLLFYE